MDNNEPDFVPPQLGPGAIDAIAERLAERLKLALFDHDRLVDAVYIQQKFLNRLAVLFPAREASLQSALDLLEEYRKRL